MRNETHDTTAESNAELLETTRRSALRGVGLAGLLAMAGGVSASQSSSEANTCQTGTKTSSNDEPIPVTWENYPRANCHVAFQTIVDVGGFGQFYHRRNVTPIEDQVAVGEDRDVLASFGVFDLTEPVTITLPDSGDRYRSMNVQNEDQYVKKYATDPGEYTITQDLVGTRYAGVVIRAFVDANDPNDLEQVRQLQDETDAEQSSAGSFEIPNWDQQSYEQLTDALVTVGFTLGDYSGAFGDVDEVDPVKFFIASTAGWTGVPNPSEAFVLQRTPAQNDGTTPHTLTVEDVPVDGFWSISVYNSDFFFEENEYDAYTVSNATAEPNDDGSVTIHFGGDPDQPNFLYTPEGWNYTVRLYQPREPILDGSYQFPEAQPVE
ncbi:hypothetical protein HAPAU_29810 [Halalkalicoccus paucihalophilus]|uniref:DUF1214 domain-containing protein n=1 Tax=Halalkalicoccus paucihalophilus TaxID=1008153 RepID=A0A151AB89_9EURY|nr:DUF1214 domain-containing protein [Halalkalicoccus paucihalophilus]KYH24889.1 hypothetical protein HAPAU_29810 [Halalkalicoccus paucihalophilus]